MALQVMVSENNSEIKNGGGEDFKSALMSSRGYVEANMTGSGIVSNLRPALGTGWYHTVTTRINLIAMSSCGPDDETEQKFGSSSEIYDPGAKMIGQRYFCINKSPMVKLGMIPFSIGPTGIS